LLAVTFLIILAEGIRYYSFDAAGKPWSSLGMALQNTAETMLFNPILTIDDIRDNEAYVASLDAGGILLLYVSMVAMAVAPFIDLLIVFSVLDSFLHIFSGYSLQKKRILVIGFNEQAARLIHGHTGGKKIYLWTDALLSEEEQRQFYAEGVHIHFSVGLSGDDREERKGFLKEMEHFLGRRRITHVLFLNASGTRNMQLYLELSSLPVCEQRTIHFYIYSNDYAITDMLQDCFDWSLKERQNALASQGNKGADTRMDLRIFDMEQIQAQELFAKLPLHTGLDSEGKKDIHLLILGDAPVGEAILLHAMNQGVLSPYNALNIDVAAEHVQEMRQRLTERFDERCVRSTEDGFVLRSPETDGCLKIRIKEWDGKPDTLRTILYNGADAGGLYTYLALCGESEDETLRYIALLDRIGREGGKKLFAPDGVPVAARMDWAERMKGYLTSCGFCSDAYLIGAEEEYLSIDHIIRDDEEQNIRRYNAVYNAVSNRLIFDEKASEEKILDNADKEWNKLEYFKRESNRALYLHQPVKDFLFDTDACRKELERFRKELKSVLDDVRKRIPEDDAGFYDEMVGACSLKLLSEENGTLCFPYLVNIARTEHRRWDHFFAGCGWHYDEVKNPRRRQHDCLTDWDKLVRERPQMIIYDLITAPGLINEK
ncbi:MAG: hypothetical protein K6G83_07100, partial [Lachnospiraceae bacterium]|nr:hypothetical protein [Lachnospiraceae bacterium]